MSASLQPYPLYKPSGIPWLGNIPPHWDVRRGKALLSPVDIRSDTGGEELLTVSARRGVVPRKSASVTMFKAESYVGYKLCWPGDLVINSLWAWAHGLGVSQHHGIVSSAYGVYRPLPKAHAQFIHLLVRSVPFQWELQVRSKGIWVSRLQLTDEAFLGAPFPLPSLPEQTAIVRYLDHVDERIRRYVSGKQKLIRLLEEEKEAVINRAVTGQVDVTTGQPYSAYKPSGIPWLGDVPAYWEVMPLRRLAISRCDGPFGSGLKSSHYTDQGIRVVRLQNIGHAQFNNLDSAFIDPSHYATLGDHTVEPEDLLIAGLGDEHHPAGRACVAPSFIVPAMVKADCFRFRLFRQRINPEFAALQLSATAGDASPLLSTGATRQRTNLQATASRPIAVPPTQEQCFIVAYIKKTTIVVDTAISRARRQIELLQEYRTRLIADVVTGQLDVRRAAANLPDEAEILDARAEFSDMELVDDHAN